MPQSKLLRTGGIDNRSREGRFLAACRAELVKHFGGNVSPTQRVLIDRIAWLRLYVAMIDERSATGKPMSAHDARCYLAFSNSISRGMRTLGLDGGPERAPPVKSYSEIRGY